MNRSYRLLRIGALLTLILIATVVAQLNQTSAAKSGAINPTLRTMVVVAPDAARPAVRAGDIVVDLESGAAPSGIHQATVLTDMDCAADAEGVSHCLNDMSVGRAQFAIRHHHKMMEEPCFSPTEQVNVIDAATYARLIDES